MEVVQQAPRLMDLLTAECVKALTATCTQFRQDFRDRVTIIKMGNEQDQAMLHADKWPSLVIVVVSTTVSITEQLTAAGNLVTSYLSDREWSTMVRIQVGESTDDPIGCRSGFKRTVALMITASHQSSQNMDTKAHGIALARLATEWVAKARFICISMRSEPACMNPFKHLHMGDWPCLESINCLALCSNALPFRCFWGDSSSNLQIFHLMQCSLGVDMIQSLVTTCPHLRHVSLTGCNIDAAALACLNQARFSRLDYLSISITPLAWSSVRSLSNCDLPALQRLTLSNTNMSTLAAMHLAQGCWPNLTHLDLFDNQLNLEAVAYLIKGEWPLLQELSLLWTCVPEAAFAELGVADACKQFENKMSINRLPYMPISLLRSSSLVWPRLKALTVRDAAIF